MKGSITCLVCNKEWDASKRDIRLGRKYCSLRCAGKRRLKWNDEQRATHSTMMKQLHADGKHPGWAHKNQDPNRRTYPERWFVKVIQNDELLSMMIIVEQLKIGKYFLDFALLEKMIDIELDGCQHQRPSSITHDQIRDKFLISAGWKVYRISWSRLCNETLTTLADLKKFILSADQSPYTIIKKIERSPLQSMVRRDARIQLIISSGINFSKFGWVAKVAKLCNIPSTGINRWMKRHMVEFYNNNCFKKKSARLRISSST